MTMSSESMDNIQTTSSSGATADIKPDFCLEDVTVEFIKDNFDGQDIISSNANTMRKKLKKITSNVASNVHGYKLQPAKNATTLIFTKTANRDASRDLQMEWRQTLQQQGQVCCPLPKCQVSYCSLRGLILHYQTCTGMRDEVEAVKCKICRQYVSCKISLAHHNRLLHRGPPMKAVDTFIEGQDRMNCKRKQQVEIGEVKTTKSMRQIRKPARFRDPTEEDDEATAEEKLAQFGLPLTAARTKKSPATATVTSSNAVAAVPLEEIRKFTFLHKMGLTRANDEGSPYSSFVMMDDSLEENEDDLPPDKNSFPKPRPNSAISSAFRAQFRRLDGSDADLHKSALHPKDETIGETKKLAAKPVKDLPLGEDGLPIRRKRGRPRKIRPEEAPPPVPAVSVEVLPPPTKKIRKSRLKHYEDPVVEQHQELTDGVVGNDEEYSESEQKTIIRQTFKKFGRLVCPREACRKPLISLPGYFYHVKNCTKQVKKIIKEDDPQVSSPVTTNAIGDNDKSFLEKGKKESLQRTLKQNGKLLCPNQGCPKSFLSIAGYMNHTKNCKPQTNSARSNCDDLPQVAVTCGVCNETSKDAASFLAHILEFHNGMARKAGDVRPFSDEEQKEALRTTLKRVGRLICPACKKAYISLQGFKYHSQSCGSGAASGPLQLADKRPFPLEEQREILKQTLSMRGVLSCSRPHCGLDFSDVEAFLEHSSKCRDEDGPVTCGVCKTFCHSEAQFRHHAMSQHNGLARPSGQSQIFTEEDEYSILRNTIRYLKKLYCLRPECGKAFISLGGYQYHVKQCGQESQYQDCPVCGKKLKMLSMRYHMKASHPPSPPPMSAAEQEAAAEQIIAASGQPKRKAAKRAREKVQEIARGIDVDDDVPSSREWRQETKDKDFPFTEFLTNDDAPYTKPTQVHISSSLFAEWRKEGETNGTIKCKNPGCTQEFALPWQMRTHYLACIHSQFDLMYTCRCGKKTRTEALMLTHQEYHLKDFHSDSEEDDKDYEFSSSKGGRKLSAAYRFSQTSGRKQIVWEPFPHAIEWTLQFRKKHYQDVIFPDWRPKSDWWKEASTSEQDIYWPATRQSVNFQTTTVPQPTHQLSSDWKQLNLFETAADQDLNSSTFFVGGPVWAMAWCPTPLGRKTAQHLAVSCHHNMDDKMVAENIQAGPGVIQIWKITDSTHPRSPLCCSLQLAICHDEGFIYQLEWCPSGCWEDETMHTEGKNMPSLGLLAASCSTGNINIFCVPHASSVKQSLKSCTFKVRPTVVLQTNPVLSSSLGPPTSPCLCLSWLRSKQHTFIAGGFADGRVALWDLQMRSPLLSLVTQEQQTLFGPFQIFQAHMCAVYDVNWAPAHHGQHLCTVGLDRQVHFWCTDDLGVPTNSVGRGRVIKLEWSPHWCGVFTSQDDCYHYTRNFMAFIDSGYQPNGSRSLTVHNGCIWDVSVNDWLNCAVSCDSSGEVVGNVLCHMMQNFHMKGIDKRRFPIYRIKLEELHVKNDDVLLEENSSIEIEVKPDILNMSNISNKDQVSPQTTECVSNSNEVQRTNTCVENLPQNKDSTQEASQDSIESDKPQKPVATTKKQKAKENEEKPFEILPTTYEDSAAKFGIVFCDAAILKGHVRPVPDSELIRLTVSTRMNRTLPHSFPLSSVNRVCWNPNLGSHLLVASGSHSGLVRIHRVTWLHHGADNRFKNMQDTSDSSEEDEEDETTSKEDATTSQTKAGDEAATSTTGCASDEFESVSSTLMDGNSVEDLLSESGVSRTECVEEEEEEAQDISGTIENETEEPEATR